VKIFNTKKHKRLLFGTRTTPKKFVQQQIAIIGLVASTGIFVASTLQVSQGQDNQSIVPGASPTTQEASTATAGIAQQVEALESAIAEALNNFTIPTSFQGKTIYEVKPKSEEKVIALTFDDGPWPKTTQQVLDILKKKNVKATFFLVGQPLKEYPAIAQQIVADGHAIGNHTWSHRYNYMNEATAAKEINDTAALIYKITGVKTSYFRPPGGALRNGLATYAQKQKYVVAMWTVDSADSNIRRFGASTLVKNVLKEAKPGGIVLLHDGGGNHSPTVQALPKIIDKLKERGYKFVTMPELLEKQNPPEIANSVSPSEPSKKSPLSKNGDR
jgi:peptidoglycan/xylan/chitin deacetylase (PgdA/CDA1 family)